MPFNSGEKKAVAIIAAVALVFVLVVGGSVAFLTKDEWSKEPQFGAIDKGDHLYVQVAVEDRLTRVDPTRMCDVFLKDCHPASDADAQPVRVPVRPGESIMVSVSEDIAKWPWQILILVQTPRGLEDTEIPFASGSKRTLVLQSTPERIIRGVEVQVPSVVRESENSYVARGIFGINTTPEESQLPGR